MSREYRIQFAGSLTLNRPLQPAQGAYLNRFIQTRRVTCSVEHLSDIPDPLREAVGLPLGAEGAYFVGIDFDKDQTIEPETTLTFEEGVGIIPVTLRIGAGQCQSIQMQTALLNALPLCILIMSERSDTN